MLTILELVKIEVKKLTASSAWESVVKAKIDDPKMIGSVPFTQIW